MKKILILLILIIVSVSTYAQDNTWQKKTDSVLNYYKHFPFSKSWYVALAKIHTNYDTATAYQIIDTLTENPQGDMFWMYPAVAFYLHEKDKLPVTYQQKIKKAFQTYTPSRGNTENHWLMYYTSLYLTSQSWPNEQGSPWFNGKSSAENLKESTDYINHWIQETTSIGQGEYDTPVYGTYYIGPLILLQQFAKDSLMRSNAEKMLSWILADYIVDYFDGVFAGGYSRLYEYDIFTKRNTNMSAIVDFLLGNEPLLMKFNILFIALGNYRLPTILKEIGTEKKEVYENLERRRCAHRLRYYQERDPVVTRYNYITSSYCMGSMFDKPAGLQQHSWHLTWKATKPGELTSLFGIHPYFSDYHLCAGLTCLRKYAVEDVIQDKTFYNKEDKWIGGSPYEQLFQYKSVLIALYDLRAKDAVFKHYDIFFPKDLNSIEEDSSGWIFTSSPTIYIAIKPFRPYKWMDEPNGKRLRSTDTLNGYVLIAENPENVKSYQDFKDKIRNKTTIRYKLTDIPVAEVKTYNNNHLKFAYNGKRIANGKIINSKDFPLFKSPYVYSKRGSYKMLITYKNEKLLVDLSKTLKN